MKKIFAIALAVVMVLSIASVAGALWEPTPADPASEFRVQVSAEKYALETGTYGYKYVATETITAANGADVYYVIKLVVPASPNAKEAAATVEVNYDGIAGTNGSWTVQQIINGAEGHNGQGGTFYYNGTTWNKSETYAYNPGAVVAQARCFDTSVASIDVEASVSRNLETRFTWNGYGILYTAPTDDASGNINIFKADDSSTYVILNIAPDGKASFNESSQADFTFAYNLFKDLGFTTDDLNNGKVYMTEKNLRTVFGYSYKVTDSVDWTATNYPIIVDTNVGIPKTGDNASVIGFAMIMVAVVAAAVAVRKVNA